MDNTYVKLYRSLLDHDTLSNDNTALIVFVKLLLKVDRHSGSLITGRFKLAALTNLKASTCWDALHRLETDSIVTLSPTGRYTTIHICNWHQYQSSDRAKTDSKPTANRVPTDTIQELRTKNKNIYNIELLNILNEVVGREFRILPKVAKKTAQMFSLDEIRLALKNLTKDEWHKTKFKDLSSDYLLKSSTIDKFLSRKDKPIEAFIPDFHTKKKEAPGTNLTRKQINALD